MLPSFKLFSTCRVVDWVSPAAFYFVALSLKAINTPKSVRFLCIIFVDVGCVSSIYDVVAFDCQRMFAFGLLLSLLLPQECRETQKICELRRWFISPLCISCFTTQYNRSYCVLVHAAAIVFSCYARPLFAASTCFTAGRCWGNCGRDNVMWPIMCCSIDCTCIHIVLLLSNVLR